MRYWTILVEMMRMGPKVKTCQTEKVVKFRVGWKVFGGGMKKGLENPR